MKRRVDPRRIIETVISIFSGVLGKHALRTIALS